jgi:CDP-paratose 2-epimerase
MHILLSGICGFVGSTLALRLSETCHELKISGFDNFVRPGSELNRSTLRRVGIAVRHADLRNASDVDALPDADWVIDAAANPSVLAGSGGDTSSRQAVEHNLFGTINLLEYCKSRRAGFILLSTSRVYSIKALSELKLVVKGNAYRPDLEASLPPGISATGLSEDFSTEPPLSIYGSTKIASEALALEYGEAFQFPVWINRCGVLAGAGQFGRAEQGIFSFWINSWLRRSPLKYIGFEGRGYQVRDCLHPQDVVPLLRKQMASSSKGRKIFNVGGGIDNSTSLAQLSEWCTSEFGPREILADSATRLFDIPWMVLDSRRALGDWAWKVETPIESILKEIAAHAGSHPDWLEVSAP